MVMDSPYFVNSQAPSKTGGVSLLGKP